MELPLKFPDRHEEMRRRCQAFQRLSPDDRIRLMLDTIESGPALIRSSPHREAIDRVAPSAGGNGGPSNGSCSDAMASEPLPVSKDVIDGAILLAEAASRSGVPYALIGGLAVGYWTELRFTQHVDCLLQVPQLKLPGLLDDLAARGVTIDQPTAIREWTQEHMTTLSFRNVLIDWLKPAIPLYQHILDRATEETGRTASIVRWPRV
jgi:hypothetical protein